MQSPEDPASYIELEDNFDARHSSISRRVSEVPMVPMQSTPAYPSNADVSGP
jgi:hypothetical protein